ncbi:histidine protein methyltransferase 1 homolog isoform X1 [Leptidea sinapis]|uniref:histidine protein methyltransferase 1 homolog isoform X1 n=1 Tax=Leptidea sinapis TaxID=189913 RepID=UPI00212A0480|nr:histidine protein methyltransferase 1 homolog isoform X1 [Leptidea sinapis]
MASFKFNFNTPEKDPQLHEKDPIKWIEAVKIEIKDQAKNIDDIAKHAKMFACGEVNIGHVITSVLQVKAENRTENVLELAEKEHSDLVPGKYEGGLKIWECTYDLIEYLEQEQIQFENLNVLDLGCGVGILGIYALLKGGVVTFQDYNKEIIENVTIFNVLLNIEDNSQGDKITDIEKCEFYSGDWESFNNILHNDLKYDVILTSETIYNTNNYDKLIKLFNQRLKKPGTVYVAAKNHYFGVGGGTKEFKKAIEESGKLKADIVWEKSSGIRREVIKIKQL